MSNELLFLVPQNQNVKVEDLEVSQGDHFVHEVATVHKRVEEDLRVVIEDLLEGLIEVRGNIQEALKILKILKEVLYFLSFIRLTQSNERRFIVALRCLFHSSGLL